MFPHRAGPYLPLQIQHKHGGGGHRVGAQSCANTRLVANTPGLKSNSSFHRFQSALISLKMHTLISLRGPWIPPCLFPECAVTSPPTGETFTNSPGQEVEEAVMLELSARGHHRRTNHSSLQRLTALPMMLRIDRGGISQ